MANKHFLRFGVLTSIIVGMAAVGIGHEHFKRFNIKPAEAVNLPSTIDLTDCTDEEIKAYYSSLSSKEDSELSGTNLLKNLKGIINNGSTVYYSYGQTQSAFVITERDWVNSPASEMSGYNSATNTITGFSHSTEVSNNPYIKMLYCDYSVKDKTKYKGDGDVSTTTVSFDQEHVWSQSHGFDNGTSSGSNLTGAGSDLHHLKAGTQYGNRTLHSNYSYGFVGQADSIDSSKVYEQLNKRGKPLIAHSEDQEQKVFEPQDSDKGDVARALLYMVACYNNYDGSTPTPANPALKLVNYVIGDSSNGYSSDNIQSGYYGILQDILAWHHMDPVDDYEIHRNNLIYKNYQHNRNPFIDYPEWVDYIWGTSEYDSANHTIDYSPESTGSIDLDSDIINGYRADDGKTVTSIEITHLPNKTEYKVGEQFDRTGMVVIATYDDASTTDVSKKCSVSVDLSSVGEKTVTVSYKGQSATFTINVKEADKQGASIPLWVWFVVGGVVLVVLIIGISVGAVKVTKKGKVKVKIPKTSSKKSSSKKKK